MKHFRVLHVDTGENCGVYWTSTPEQAIRLVLWEIGWDLNSLQEFRATPIKEREYWV